MELVLYETGVIKRIGTVEDGNTVSDYDNMEIETKHSINMSMIPVEYKDVKIICKLCRRDFLLPV